MPTSYHRPDQGQLSLFDDPPDPDSTPSPTPPGNGEVIKRSGSYWITGLRHVEDCGPYLVRKEAEEDLRGMRRTLAEMEGSR